MSKRSKRVSGAATMVIAGVVAACSGDQPNTQQIAVAQTPPVAVADPVTTPEVTPAPPTKITSVSYRDAETVYRNGRYADAAEFFAVYAAEHPTNFQGHYMLGLSAWKSGDHKRAENALQRAVELDSQSVKARTNLGRVLLEQGRAQEALPHIEKATELSPDSHEVWRVLGNVQSELGRSEEAIAAYRHALLRNEQDAWSMNNYALVLIRLGRYEEALPPLARAVELAPRSAIFQNNLGVALERTGQLGGARRAFATALEADSTYRKAQLSLERVQTRLGGGEVEGEVMDLTPLARSFMEELSRWRASSTDHEC